jgi:preprotein translocase subunit SecA
VIYQQRNELLEADSMAETSLALRHGVFTDLFRSHVPEGSMEEQWDLDGLQETLLLEWQIDLPMMAMLEAEPELTDDDLLERLIAKVDQLYQAKVDLVDVESFSGFERNVMLQSMDSHWREHLAALDHLRQGIHLRGYAQKNPKQEYKREAFQLFAQMLDLIRNDVVRVIVTVRIQSREEIAAAEAQMNQPHLENVNYQHADFDPSASPEELLAPPSLEGAGAMANGLPKVGRNDPCPCGSGKKYKQCHGRLA